jgi:hypothetical protein
MYLFARDMMGKEHTWPPLVAAIAYSYGPYLLHTLYVRGAIAEQGAQMLLPWIFWSFRRIWRSATPRHHVIVAALSLAALAFTHTISLLIIPIFLVGYLAILPWSADQIKVRLFWSGIALAAAMGISCFYWLPLIIERDYVSTLAYTISQQRFLPYSFLGAQNFLYNSLSYIYTKDFDYRLTIVQVMGCLIGLPFIARQARQDRAKEWWYWVGVLVACGVMMNKVTQAVWFNYEIFAIIQFPYRLLTLFQVPIALLTALPLCYLNHRFVRAVASVAVIALLIWAYLPRLPWSQRMSPTTSTFNMPMNAFFEVSIKQIVEVGSIVTSVQEFRPRWVSMALELVPETVDAQSPPAEIQPLAANPLHLRLRTAAPASFSLRLNTFFFPGWQITLDDTTVLTSYPSTNLGLLTAEIPAGEHIIDVRWTGTIVSFWAGLLSQLTLLLLMVWQFTLPGRRLWGPAIAALLLLALVASYWQPPLYSVAMIHSDQIPGVRLVGFGEPKVEKEGITVYPYWFVLETHPPGLKVRWELHNVAGQVVAQSESSPFFDAYDSDNWPANTLVDDAHFIPLPSDLPAGSYQVVMMPLDESDEKPLVAIKMGAVTLEASTPEVVPPHPLEVHFGENVLLKGYGLRLVERLLTPLSYLEGSPEVAILYAGEDFIYRLFWQLTQETDEPYIGFIHLTDRHGKPLVQRDQSPGPIFSPVEIWGTGRIYEDDYLLSIPEDAPSGLYWPQVGMYDWEDVERFDVSSTDGTKIGDHFQLPPIKVINDNFEPAGMPVAARFGEMAELVSYEIHNPSGSDLTGSSRGPFVVTAGSVLTFMAYYSVQQPAPTALTRFIQMRDVTGDIIAQLDSEPQDGANPTWAWLPGEIVQDTARLTIPVEASPGEYAIYIGFYDPSANFVRLPVSKEPQGRLPNDELPLPESSNVLTVRVVK